MKNTQHVRILSSTYRPNEKTKVMIGGIFEVRAIDYSDKTFGVYVDKENTDWLWFNFSDVQEVCLEAVVDGYVLGVGDLIKGKPILGFYVYDSSISIRCGTKDDTCTHYIHNTKLKDITPLYKPTVETIKIGEKLYNKSEVDTALANLKEIK